MAARLNSIHEKLNRAAAKADHIIARADSVDKKSDKASTKLDCMTTKTNGGKPLKQLCRFIEECISTIEIVGYMLLNMGQPKCKPSHSLRASGSVGRKHSKKW